MDGNILKKFLRIKSASVMDVLIANEKVKI